MSLGDSLLSFFGITKRRVITVAAAATIVSSSFGFLMRDLVNFGKVEGDKKLAFLVKKESKIFKESLAKLEKINVDKSNLADRELKEFTDAFLNTRNVINALERAREEAVNEEEKGDFDAALERLSKVYSGLEKVILYVPRAPPKISIWSKEKEINIGEKLLPYEALELLREILEEVQEDIAADIVRIQSAKENNESEALTSAYQAHKKACGK